MTRSVAKVAKNKIQNVVKERRVWKSHGDKGYRKATKLKSILNESKPDQRVTVEGKENSANRY